MRKSTLVGSPIAVIHRCELRDDRKTTKRSPPKKIFDADRFEIHTAQREARCPAKDTEMGALLVDPRLVEHHT
jgi:hypothetical protein